MRRHSPRETSHNSRTCPRTGGRGCSGSPVAPWVGMDAGTLLLGGFSGLQPLPEGSASAACGRASPRWAAGLGREGEGSGCLERAPAPDRFLGLYTGDLISLMVLLFAGLGGTINLPQVWQAVPCAPGAHSSTGSCCRQGCSCPQWPRAHNPESNSHLSFSTALPSHAGGVQRGVARGGVPACSPLHPVLAAFPADTASPAQDTGEARP